MTRSTISGTGFRPVSGVVPGSEVPALRPVPVIGTGPDSPKAVSEILVVWSEVPAFTPLPGLGTGPEAVPEVVPGFVPVPGSGAGPSVVPEVLDVELGNDTCIPVWPFIPQPCL